MKQTRKALLICIFSAISLIAFNIYAQKNTHFDFEGTWVLDSVQVKEIMPENIVEKTVLPSEKYNLDDNWILQFTLGTSASYVEKNGHALSNVFYIIDGSIVTFYITAIEQIILNTEPLSEKSILITHSSTTEYNSQTVEIFRKMFYHKVNK